MLSCLTWEAKEPSIKKNSTEGCLSIPKIHGHVVRPKTVKIEALNENGEKFVKEFSGLEAACICHENDHLNGVLYIDRMNKDDRKKIEKQLRDLKKSNNK